MTLKTDCCTTKITPAQRRDIDQFIADLNSDAATPLLTQGEVPSRNNIFLSASGNLIFKVYALMERKLIERLRAKWKIPSKKFGHRFGWAEFLNAQRAAKHGIQIAHPVAYLQDTAFFTCKLQVVAFERLKEHRTLLDALRSGEAPAPLLERAESAIWALSLAGIFHLDLNCRNILLPCRAIEDCRIIDWEYACFDRKDILALHAHYLGYLYFDGAGEFIAENDYDAWARQKIQRRAIDIAKDDGSTSPAQSYAFAKQNRHPRHRRYHLFA